MITNPNSHLGPNILLDFYSYCKRLEKCKEIPYSLHSSFLLFPFEVFPLFFLFSQLTLPSYEVKNTSVPANELLPCWPLPLAWPLQSPLLSLQQQAALIILL